MIPWWVTSRLYLLRYVYNLALEWEIPRLKETPTKGIRQFKENNKRERFLTPEETKRLCRAIEASPNPLLTPIAGHHVIPLSEGGPDKPDNVVALCPNHHREAHHGATPGTRSARSCLRT